MPAWSPYSYTFNNPLIYTDPTGMAPEWIDNGDGTYTAEAGDSANSLAQDADITLEEADKIVQEQYGPNYMGEDGEMKSNVDPGDVVDVCCNEKTQVEQNELDRKGDLKNKNEKLQSSIAVKDKFEKELDSMKDARLDFMNDPKNSNEKYGNEPSGGMSLFRTVKGHNMEMRERRKQKQIDSTKKLLKNKRKMLEVVNCQS